MPVDFGGNGTGTYDPHWQNSAGAQAAADANKGNPSFGGVYGQANRTANSMSGLADYFRNRQGPTLYDNLSSPENARQQAMRQQQVAALDMQRQAAMGGAPSAAAIQQSQGLSNALAAQYAAANAGRGAIPGAQGAMAAQGLGITQGGAAARAQEIAQARNAYANGAGGMRGQDLGVFGAMSQQEIEQAKLAAQQRALNDASGLRAYDIATGIQQAQLAADAQTYGVNAQSQLAAAQGQAEEQRKNFAGAVGMVGGVMGAMSDARVKRDIETEGVPTRPHPALGEVLRPESYRSGLTLPGELAKPSVSDERKKMEIHRTDADAFLEHLHPYSYRYKDPTNEPSSEPTGGRYLGVMAQDVERTPTGDTIVRDTPHGKVLQGGALMSAMAAGLGRLHERLSQIESRMPAKRGK